jgi:hypothetical protein
MKTIPVFSLSIPLLAVENQNEMKPMASALGDRPILCMRCEGTMIKVCIFVASLTPSLVAAEPIEIGTRRELFVDDYLIATMQTARRVLNHPTPREISLVRNKPWEGNASGKVTVFRDGDLYRMYYRGRQWLRTGLDGHPTVICYAESKDGITWTRPDLGLVEFNGSKKNNIIWDAKETNDFSVFKDLNPDCPLDLAYKAVGRTYSENYGKNTALFAFGSPDGIHWKLIREEPIASGGAFDSTNLAFWDTARGEYRAYFRGHRGVVRHVRTVTSPDFRHWSKPVYLKFESASSDRQSSDQFKPSRVNQLYTNQIIPYYRAPHILLGFPTRYVDYGWTESTKQLPQYKWRKRKASLGGERAGTAMTDGMFMSSRDGQNFEIWPESFRRPGIQRPGSWAYGDNYQNWGLVETKSQFDGAPNELSMYVSEAYKSQFAKAADEKLGVFVGQSQGNPDLNAQQPELVNRLRRYAIRVDGFVSVQAPLSGGELITKPLQFDGAQLEINFSTSAAGNLRVEIQDTNGNPLPGFALADCHSQYGDQLDRVVSWKQGADVGGLAGKPVRIRFELKDADLYSFGFSRESEP